jgi:hypothetical protein
VGVGVWWEPVACEALPDLGLPPPLPGKEADIAALPFADGAFLCTVTVLVTVLPLCTPCADADVAGPVSPTASA